MSDEPDEPLPREGDHLGVRFVLGVRGPQVAEGRQCDLLDLPRSTAYYAPIPESAENLALMKEIDAVYLDNLS